MNNSIHPARNSSRALQKTKQKGGKATAARSNGHDHGSAAKLSVPDRQRILGPQITLSIGGNRTTQAVSSVNEDALTEIRDHLTQPSGTSVAVEIAGLTSSRPEEQVAAWQLLRELQACGPLTLTVDGRSFTDAVDAAIGMVVGPGDPRHQTSLQSAVAALRICCPTDSVVDMAAGRLAKHLKHNGLSARATTLAKDIRQAGQAAAKPLGLDATLAATQFIEAREKQVGASPAIAYFNGDFYEWRQKWWRLETAEFAAGVTNFLQHSPDYKITQKFIGDVLANIRGQTVLGCGNQGTPFFVDEFGPRPQVRKRQLIVMQNGMVDLAPILYGKSPKLLKFNPAWFTNTQLPYKFKPNAKCPRLLEFLQHVLEIDANAGEPRREGDQRLQVLQQFFGYCLLHDARFQKFMIMVGLGSNGKGVVLNLLNKMLGHENVSHISIDQLSGQFALEPLVGKMANICGDLSEVDSVAEGTLKRLTGEDNLTVHRKNRLAITMAPGIKLIFATNTLPRFADKTDGMWRRLIAMPFDVVIPADEQNKNLARELEEELPGILNWAITGLQRLLQQGGFTDCAVCKQVQEQHRIDCDPVAQFIDECIELQEGATVPCQSVYDAYTTWCDANGRRLPLSSSEFSRQITRRLKRKLERESKKNSSGKRPYRWTGFFIAGTVPTDNKPRQASGGPPHHQHRTATHSVPQRPCRGAHHGRR